MTVSSNGEWIYPIRLQYPWRFGGRFMKKFYWLGAPSRSPPATGHIDLKTLNYLSNLQLSLQAAGPSQIPAGWKHVRFHKSSTTKTNVLGKETSKCNKDIPPNLGLTLHSVEPDVWLNKDRLISDISWELTASGCPLNAGSHVRVFFAHPEHLSIIYDWC